MNIQQAQDQAGKILALSEARRRTSLKKLRDTVNATFKADPTKTTKEVYKALKSRFKKSVSEAQKVLDAYEQLKATAKEKARIEAEEQKRKEREEREALTKVQEVKYLAELQAEILTKSKTVKASVLQQFSDFAEFVQYVSYFAVFGDDAKHLLDNGISVILPEDLKYNLRPLFERPFFADAYKRMLKRNGVNLRNELKEIRLFAEEYQDLPDKIINRLPKFTPWEEGQQPENQSDEAAEAQNAIIVALNNPMRANHFFKNPFQDNPVFISFWLYSDIASAIIEDSFSMYKDDSTLTDIQPPNLLIVDATKVKTPTGAVYTTVQTYPIKKGNIESGGKVPGNTVIPQNFRLAFIDAPSGYQACIVHFTDLVSHTSVLFYDSY